MDIFGVNLDGIVKSVNSELPDANGNVTSVSVEATVTTNIVSGDINAAQAGAVADKFTNEFSVIAKNLYSTSIGHVGGILNSVNGAIVANASYNSTNLIVVTPSTQIVSSSGVNSGVRIPMRTVCSYDSSGVFISGVDNVNNYTAPVNAKYIRVSYNISVLLLANFDTLQIEYALNPSDYESYYDPRFKPVKVYNDNQIGVDALSFSNSRNLLKNLVQGFIDTSGVITNNATYYVSENFINVSPGQRIITYEKDVYQPINYRTVCAYDINRTPVPLSGVSAVEGLFYYDVPVGIEYIKFCFVKTKVSTLNVQTSIGETPFLYSSFEKKVESSYVSPDIISRLKDVSVLTYGDSKMADGQWLNVMSAFTGISKVRNMAIGGANIKIFSTRDEITDPYDYRFDNPTLNPTDTFNDRHFVPQVDHTPNTLRWKYDLISSTYLQTDGRYIYYPDIVIIALGFNDWKNSTTNSFEAYTDVKNLTYAQLVTRANDPSVTTEKVFTFFRIALEKLMSGEVLETRDGMTYGIDCRKSKFIFSTPIQNANPISYTDSGTVVHSKNLEEFGDYLNECLRDYGIKRINGYTDSGICWRYEVVGGNGKFLADGVHPNTDGYKKLGSMIAGGILSTYLK